LFELVKMIPGAEAGGLSDQDSHHTEVSGVSTDSRNISRGNLFVPLVGERFDGHEFAKDALQSGASALLWQRDHMDAPNNIPLIYVDDTLRALQSLAGSYRDQLGARVIGITGSNGKTTTKDMVASVLSTTYKVHKTIGNLNNHIGVPLTLLQAEEDTEMLVVEMGMSGRGEIALLSQIARPEAAIITNIGEAHLQQLGSREEIARAKLEILSGLKEGGFFVYHGDEPLLEMALKEGASPGNMVRFRFGESGNNDFYPAAMMLDENGTRFFVNNERSPDYYIPLLGKHNVVNALAAIAIGKYMGVGEADIIRGLKDMRATGMRIEMVKGVSGLTILNDAYNASPTSMKAALGLLKQLTGYEKKFAVLGDMLELGGNEKEFHREIGRILNPDDVDYIFTYGALAQCIAEEAVQIFAPDRVVHSDSKETIAEKIAILAGPKDIALVKGSRGMRLEHVVNRLKDIRL
jgi:UDP-N-acetylmuramoyl-tripeptide--D-alanyl-D-alanine ligase